MAIIMYFLHGKFNCLMGDSNPRPSSLKSNVLPTELTRPLDLDRRAVNHIQQHHFSICKFQTDPMWVRFPALNSFLGLERQFDHQKKGLDVAQATTAMICARDPRKQARNSARNQARNSEQRQTTSNWCSPAVIGRSQYRVQHQIVPALENRTQDPWRCSALDPEL